MRAAVRTVLLNSRNWNFASGINRASLPQWNEALLNTSNSGLVYNALKNKCVHWLDFSNFGYMSPDGCKSIIGENSETKLGGTLFSQASNHIACSGVVHQLNTSRSRYVFAVVRADDGRGLSNFGGIISSRLSGATIVPNTPGSAPHETIAWFGSFTIFGDNSQEFRVNNTAIVPVPSFNTGTLSVPGDAIVMMKYVSELSVRYNALFADSFDSGNRFYRGRAYGLLGFNSTLNNEEIQGVARLLNNYYKLNLTIT